ncbi:hypothetical protein EWM64_g10394, partial [Hericium alpestre]
MPHSLIGKPAPALTTLRNYDGNVYDFQPANIGTPTALFFFPKAGSYGCTREVCQFRDALEDAGALWVPIYLPRNPDKIEFKDTHVHVVGVSPDSVDKLKAFAEKQKVNYPILSDEKGEARKLYSPGKSFFGLSEARTTFFIDQTGVVRDVYESTINFSAHVKFVTKALHDWEKEHKKEGDKPAQAEPAPAAGGAEAPPA